MRYEDLPDHVKAMDPMFEEAKAKGLWFHSQSMAGVFWWKPEELREEQLDGRFRWSAENFDLRDPRERLIELADDIETAQKNFDKFKKRMG